MCFGNINYQLLWLDDLIDVYRDIYDDNNITKDMDMNVLHKYCMKIRHWYSSNHKLAFLSKQKELPILSFNNSEKDRYESFLEKIQEIHEEYCNNTKKHICVNPHFFLHYCFPEKNIIPDYYPISLNKKFIYDDIWNEIVKIIIS